MGILIVHEEKKEILARTSNRRKGIRYCGHRYGADNVHPQLDGETVRVSIPPEDFVGDGSNPFTVRFIRTRKFD